MSILAPESAVARAVDDLLDRVDSAADQIQTLARLGVRVHVDAEEGAVGVHILLPSSHSAELLPVLAARINSPGTVRHEPGRREAVGHLADGHVSVRVTAPDPQPADPRTPAERALGEYLLALVRAADAQVPEHRRVPRTVAAMQACLTERTVGTS